MWFQLDSPHPCTLRPPATPKIQRSSMTTTTLLLLLFAGGSTAGSAGKTLTVTWSNCGSPKGTVKTLTPAVVTIGEKTTFHGAGAFTEDIAEGQFHTTIQSNAAVPIKILDHKGDLCSPDTVKLPFGIGELGWSGLACPVKAGPLALDISLTLSSSLPSWAGKTTTHIEATNNAGEQLLCIDLKLTPPASSTSNGSLTTTAAVVNAQCRKDKEQCWSAYPNNCCDGLVCRVAYPPQVSFCVPVKNVATPVPKLESTTPHRVTYYETLPGMEKLGPKGAAEVNKALTSLTMAASSLRGSAAADADSNDQWSCFTSAPIQDYIMCIKGNEYCRGYGPCFLKCGLCVLHPSSGPEVNSNNKALVSAPERAAAEVNNKALASLAASSPGGVEADTSNAQWSCMRSQWFITCVNDNQSCMGFLPCLVRCGLCVL